MIHVPRARTTALVHPDFTGERLIAKLTRLLEARIANGDAIEFAGAIGDWKKTKAALQRESFDKCAYCESDTTKVAHGDVEHFRPKSKYWWLALCVDNYVFACQQCNQTFKSDSFPVVGTALKGPKLPRKLPSTTPQLKRLIASVCPDPLTVTDQELLSKWFKEDADLPHPYLEDPEPLFAWAVSEVNQEVHLVAPPNASQRSVRAVQAAITYLGLNRETLTRSRFLILANLRFALSIWANSTGPNKKAAAQQIQLLCESKQQYAGMCRYFARIGGFSV